MTNERRKFTNLAATLLLTVLVVASFWLAREAILEKGVVAAKAGQYSEAMRYLKPLGYLGDSEAQRLIGDFYAFGWGVTKDDAEALRWYDKLGAEKSAEVQFYAGKRYDEGLGVVPDKVAATSWFRRAAERGFERAREKLNKSENKQNSPATYNIQPNNKPG